MLILSNAASAVPIKVTTKLKGTNQLEIMFGPVSPNPELFYEVLARTNTPEGHWFGIYSCLGTSNRFVSGTVNLNERGLTAKSVSQLVFAAGGGDYDGNTISDLYDQLVFRGDPYLQSGEVDPYATPMGDGWSNSEKYNHGLPPYEYCRPPDPRIAPIQFFVDTNPAPTRDRREPAKAVITWSQDGPAEYFTIERADCSLRKMTNPPPRKLPYSRQPPELPFVYGPFHPIARVPYRRGVRDYQYVENIDGFLMPEYRLHARYALPPPRASLDKVNARSIAKTVISVSANATTNGYELTVPRPIPSARYLLLVRDKNDRQWRGSGYFESGTNRNPVHLRVDRTGMMTEGQAPVALPAAKFLPPVIDPEFVAGWGEDSDGDGLPDIYEVLVTKTAPDNADTGTTGVIDGFKDLAGDGWNNLMKFHLRANPLAIVSPPAAAELNQPTTAEMARALMPRTIFPFVPSVQMRTAGSSEFKPVKNLQEVYQLSFKEVMKNPHSANVRLDFDLRVSWAAPEYWPPTRGDGP